MFASVFVNC